MTIPPDPNDRTYAIIGAAIEVHRNLGPGYLESVYGEALQVELAKAGIPFVRECPLEIYYKGEKLGCEFRADFMCFGSILVELKAQVSIGKPEIKQVLNYLRASKNELGLLLNFGAPILEKKRVIFKEGWTRDHPVEPVVKDLAAPDDP